MNKILFAIISILSCQTAKTQNILQLWYPYKINVLPNCGFKTFERNIPVTTNSAKEVRLFSLKKNSKEYKILFNGSEVQEQDTISLTAAKPAIFKVRFEAMPENQDSLYFSFETSIDSMEIFKKVSIQLLFKKYVISQDALRTQKDHIVELSKSCLDSITVYFPFGGTETTISLYKTQSSQKPIRSIRYKFDSNAINYMTFSKKDIGRYFVTLTSCWWGDDFWLTIK